MIAGIDIGGTKIAIGLVDNNGKVISHAQVPVRSDRGPAQALDRIVDELRKQLVQAGVTLTGIGIACTGPVDSISGELGNVNTLRGWEGWNPVKELAKIFQVRAAMENDADAAALGEIRWGVGRGKQSLIGITVGTGIGGGIILGGMVYRGTGNTHPEIGHHLIDPSGPLCTCGIHGCWESLASGPALEQWYFKQNPFSGNKSAKEICDLARSGDSLAQQAVARLARYLGIGIANVVSMFAPDVIALSGSVMKSADLLLEPIRIAVRENCALIPTEKCQIMLSLLAENTGVIGAAQVWHSRFGD